ncbi:MAG: deoxyguanosinetriphosphate triphosphohydrolase [Coriobacteriia bacterium]|nr:deoxyguanosinetriphosphate triphosphohydrolase [Coriobacteriia bacterium]
MTENAGLTREDLEAREHRELSPYAAYSDATRGRQRPRPADLRRTEFQRDRDRILHCKSFRRLSHKTQVFIAPEGDHYRTRLTHTLEVSQIARTVARSLALNEDLTEAIALGHDLGHTPFGHTGEEALTAALTTIADRYPEAPRSFKHVQQSLRVVEELEYDGKGLNLCWETRDGILGHSGGHHPATLEGQIVRTADRMAYINHDIDDAQRAGILTEDDLPAGSAAVLGHSLAQRITTLIEDMVEASAGRDVIVLSDPVERALLEVRAFMFKAVYSSPSAKSEGPKAQRLVEQLFYYYLDHPGALPAEYQTTAASNPVQAVIDYVSGMTDRFAIRVYEELFVPSRWALQGV